MKRSIARTTGIPTTYSGRMRKMRKSMPFIAATSSSNKNTAEEVKLPAGCGTAIFITVVIFILIILCAFITATT